MTAELCSMTTTLLPLLMPFTRLMGRFYCSDGEGATHRRSHDHTWGGVRPSQRADQTLESVTHRNAGREIRTGESSGQPCSCLLLLAPAGTSRDHSNNQHQPRRLKYLSRLPTAKKQSNNPGCGQQTGLIVQSL